MIKNNFLKAAQNHYSSIAGIYRELRNTDTEPVLFIKEKLADLEEVTAADIGSGAGRYAKLLFDHLGKDRLFLKCYDTNEFMLESLEEYLKQHDIKNYLIKIATSEELPLDTGSLDAIFCFNAIHHFNIHKFLKEAVRVLKPDGRLFIFTRSRSQSKETIWGKYFPLFNLKESRFYELDEFEFILEELPKLKLTEKKLFSFKRNNTIDDLVRRASSKHYYTFELYDDHEFKRSMVRFKENLKEAFTDLNSIDWIDEKIMYVVKKIN